MTPAAILEILTGLLGAAPQLLALFHQASGGQAVSASDVSAVLTQYGIDRAILVADIATADATAGGGPSPGAPT
jgi:hypothetical protein